MRKYKCSKCYPNDPCRLQFRGLGVGEAPSFCVYDKSIVPAWKQEAAQGSGQNSQTTSTTPARSPAAEENSLAGSLDQNAPEEMDYDDTQSDLYGDRD